MLETMQKDILTELKDVIKQYFDKSQMELMNPLLTSYINKQLTKENFLSEFNDLQLFHEQSHKTISDTILMAIKRIEIFSRADSSKIERFRYTGKNGKDDICKEFCHPRLERLFYLNKIIQMDNGIIKPVLFFGGGWNCHHYWEEAP